MAASSFGKRSTLMQVDIPPSDKVIFAEGEDTEPAGKANRCLHAFSSIIASLSTFDHSSALAMGSGLLWVGYSAEAGLNDVVQENEPKKSWVT
jgi:hypothetical protein